MGRGKDPWRWPKRIGLVVLGAALMLFGLFLWVLQLVDGLPH